MKPEDCCCVKADQGKGTGGTRAEHGHTDDFRTSETPTMGSKIVPRRHTQLRTHAHTNETKTISRLDSPPNLRYYKLWDFVWE